MHFKIIAFLSKLIYDKRKNRNPGLSGSTVPFIALPPYLAGHLIKGGSSIADRLPEIFSLGI
jgi:hypothetical protein